MASPVSMDPDETALHHMKVKIYIRVGVLFGMFFCFFGMFFVFFVCFLV